MASRRAHTKSRTGCLNCKRRKVKCDEAHPTCFNCRRHGVSCSLSAGPALDALSPGLAEYDRHRTCGPLQKRSPVTPASISTDGGVTPSSGTETGAEAETETEGMRPIPPNELWSRDMELMHHYCTITAATMAIRPDMIHVWQVIMPQQAYQNPFIFHGILAISAAHKAYLIPHSRDMYLNLSDYHYNIGSEGLRSRLANINTENWKSIFVFTSLVVLYILIVPTRSENLHATSPIDNVLELIRSVRGVRATLAPFLSLVKSGDLAPLVYGVWSVQSGDSSESIPGVEYSNLPLDIVEALTNLRQFHSTDLPSASVEPYVKAVEGLLDSVKCMAAAGVHAEVGCVMSWAYMIDDCILVDMRERKPHAMLLIAYYAVLVGALERPFWYMRGWARPVVQQIEILLADQPRFAELMCWPKEHTCRC